MSVADLAVVLGSAAVTLALGVYFFGTKRAGHARVVEVPTVETGTQAPTIRRTSEV